MSRVRQHARHMEPDAKPAASASAGRREERSRSPFVRSLLHLQQTVGNAAVGQLMSAFVRRAGAGRQPLASLSAAGVIQGKFVSGDEPEIFIDTDTQQSYERIGEDDLDGYHNRVYIMQNSNERVFVDVTTMEPVNPHTMIQDENKIKSKVKKRKRSEMEEDNEDDSYLEESSDDDTVTLDKHQKMEIHIGKGRSRKKRALNHKFDTNEDGVVTLHNPQVRKLFALNRNINKTTPFMVGEQKHLISEGKRHYIMNGGNNRSETLKEPPGDYEGLFSEMKLMGKDPNANKLYEMATGSGRKNSSQLSDPEIAAIALYFFKHDAMEIAQKLGSRTQLLEHLNKLVTICDVAEFSRSMEAKLEKQKGSKKKTKEVEDIPYDSTLFIKGGFLKIAEGEKKYTLRKMFFEGTGGRDSIYMGAPSGTKAPTGGAQILRHPFNYDEQLEKQMSIFPDNKGDFKRMYNRLKSMTKLELHPLSTDEENKILLEEASEKVQQAKNLTNEIKNTALPKKIEHFNDFINDNSGEIKSYDRKIKKLRKLCGKNKEAKQQLLQARKELNNLRERALKAL